MNTKKKTGKRIPIKEAMENRFTRVDLSKELRADTDGVPVFRMCYEHETLMSFYDDDGNYAFREWCEEEGSKLFYKWIEKHSEYKTMCSWQNEK